MIGVNFPRPSHPQKHEGGYSNVTKLIHLLEETLNKWWLAMCEERSSDDNAVARYLCWNAKKQLHERRLTHNAKLQAC